MCKFTVPFATILRVLATNRCKSTPSAFAIFQLCRHEQSSMPVHNIAVSCGVSKCGWANILMKASRCACNSINVTQYPSAQSFLIYKQGYMFRLNVSHLQDHTRLSLTKLNLSLESDTSMLHFTRQLQCLYALRQSVETNCALFYMTTSILSSWRQAQQSTSRWEGHLTNTLSTSHRCFARKATSDSCHIN